MQGMQALLGPLLSIGIKKKMGFIVFARIEKDIKQLTELAERGSITPVIDYVFSYEDTPDAIWSILRHHAQGKTVIAVSQ